MMKFLLININDISNTTIAIAAFITAAAVIIGAVGPCRRAVWKIVDRLFFMKRRERKAMLALVQTIGERTERMDAQLKDNGGSSLRDVVLQTRDVCGYLSARTRYQDDASPDAIFELDDEGQLTFANCTFCELLDADEKDLKHRDYIARIHGDDRDRFEHELERSRFNKMPLETIVTFSVGKAGPKSVQLILSPDVRADKKLRGYFCRAVPLENAGNA